MSKKTVRARKLLDAVKELGFADIWQLQLFVDALECCARCEEVFHTDDLRLVDVLEEDGLGYTWMCRGCAPRDEAA